MHSLHLSRIMSIIPCFFVQSRFVCVGPCAHYLRLRQEEPPLLKSLNLTSTWTDRFENPKGETSVDAAVSFILQDGQIFHGKLGVQFGNTGSIFLGGSVLFLEFSFFSFFFYRKPSLPWNTF
uniref:Uncharacterized protein n=1 Tax=Cacopsylla melanoneura TaxID=428564 RepID=A0A8D9FG56_9HEMI